VVRGWASGACGRPVDLPQAHVVDRREVPHKPTSLHVLTPGHRQVLAADRHGCHAGKSGWNVRGVLGPADIEGDGVAAVDDPEPDAGLANHTASVLTGSLGAACRANQAAARVTSLAVHALTGDSGVHSSS